MAKRRRSQTRTWARDGDVGRRRADVSGYWLRGGGAVPAAAGAITTLPCAICGHRGRGQARVRFLPHGLHVWLCAVHGNLAFLLRDGGREFARRLHRRWVSNGEFGPRRRLALAAHVERIRRLAGAGDKPGSHSWPKLRREAERRFAAGDDPATVIHDLRLDVSGGPAVAPSLRTFRRWFAEGRWLLPAPPAPADHPPIAEMATPPEPCTPAKPPHDTS